MESFFEQMSDNESDGYASENDEELTLENILKENEKTKSHSISLCGIQLSELPEIFKSLDHITELNVYDIGLKSLKNMPPNLIKLEASANEIRRLTDTLPESLESLEINRCMLEYIERLPSKLKRLDISYNTLVELPIFSDSLRFLDAGNNFITNIDHLPDSIESLDLYANKITVINKLPNNLKKFIAYNCKIKEIKSFPDNLEVIDIDFNELVVLPELPSKLSDLTAVDNNITTINLRGGKIPDYLETMELRRNPLTHVSQEIINCPFVKISHEVLFMNRSKDPELIVNNELKEKIKRLKNIYKIELKEIIKV
jgi:hypothetical protein